MDKDITLFNDEPVPATPKKRANRRRKKLNPEIILPIDETQIVLAFEAAGEQRDPGRTVMPVKVSNGISSSQMVTQVFNKFRYTGYVPGLEPKQNGRPVKIVLDTDTVQLDTYDKFTEFDRAVLEAVFAQLSAGNTIMTPAMIYRTMTGKDTGASVSSEMIDAVNESIEKCMYGSVSIPTVSKKTGETITLDSTILNLIRATYNIAGHRTQAYEVQSIPMLYSYCKSIGALTPSPIEMNDTLRNMTKRSVALTNHLQRIITPYIFDANGNCIMAPNCEHINEDEVPPFGAVWVPPEVVNYRDLYDTVISLGGEMKSKSDKWVQMRTRSMIEGILDRWVSAGYIKSWETIALGKCTYHHIRIHFHPVIKHMLPVSETDSSDTGVK